jgi:hypothetical protein
MKKAAMRMVLAAAVLGGALVGCAPQDDDTEVTEEQLRKRCRTIQPTLMEQLAIEEQLGGSEPDEMFKDGETLAAGTNYRDIAVHALVVRKGEGRANGDIPDSMIEEQIRVLNEAFAGKSSDKAHDMRIRYHLKTVERITKPEWYNLNYGTQAEVDMKTSFFAKHPGSNVLRMYFSNLSGGLLGWATFPTWYTDAEEQGFPGVKEKEMDGVVILSESLPGGTAEPYNLGDTATHEVGHWVGLWHTFQIGCNAPGDSVLDTPRVRSPNFGCPTAVDSCPATSSLVTPDQVENFMDYTDDSCMDRFTPRQGYRGRNHFYRFRDRAEYVPFES